MPRVYKPATERSKKANHARDERMNALSPFTTFHEGFTPTDTAAPSALMLAQDTLPALLATDDSPPYNDHVSLRHAALLQAYVSWPTDPMPDAIAICESVGYHHVELHSAQALLRTVIDGMNATSDLHLMMRTSGMGEMWWMRRLYQTAQCGSPRVEVQALKLAGLALGAFDDPHPSAGAKVVIEAAVDDGKAAVRVTMSSDEQPTDSSNSVSFPTSKPSRRRKVMRNLA